MSKVYVVQNQHRWDRHEKVFVPKYDFTPAAEYGEMVDLLSPTAAPFRTDSIIEELHEKLRNFTSNDYLLLVGNPVLIGISMAIAADYNQGDLNVLQWSGKDRKYLPIVVKNIYQNPRETE